MKRHFTDITTASREMKNGEIFSFTFGTLAHYDEVMFIDGVPHANLHPGSGKFYTRLYV